MRFASVQLFLGLQSVLTVVVVGASKLRIRGVGEVFQDPPIEIQSDFALPPWESMGKPIIMEEDGMGTYMGKIETSPDGKTFAMGTYLEDAKQPQGVAGFAVETYTYVDKAQKWIPLDDHIRIDLPEQGLGASFDMAMGDRSLAMSKVGYNVSGADEVHTYFLVPTRSQTRWMAGMPPLVNDGDNKETEAFGASVALVEKENTFFVAVAILGIGDVPPKGRIQMYEAVQPDEDEDPYWAKAGQSIVGESTRFGDSMKLSQDGSTLAACDVRKSPNGTRSSHIKVYKLSEKDKTWEWERKGKDIEGKSSDDYFHCSNLDLSADGSTITCGSRGTNYDDDTASGLVRVWSYDDRSADWLQKGKDIDVLAPAYFSNAKNTRITFGSQLNLSRNGTRLAVTVERVSKQGFTPLSYITQNQILTFDWTDDDHWVQLNGDIDLQFRVESVALSDGGEIVATALTDVYLQNVAAAFNINKSPWKESLNMALK